MACNWSGALYYGLLLHLAVISSAFVLFLNANLPSIRELLRRAQAVHLDDADRNKVPLLATKKKSQLHQQRGEDHRASPKAALQKESRPERWTRAFARVSGYDLSKSSAARNCEVWRRLQVIVDPVPSTSSSASSSYSTSSSSTTPSKPGAPTYRGNGDLLLPLLPRADSLLLLAAARLLLYIAHALALFLTLPKDLGVVMLWILPALFSFLSFALQSLVILPLEGFSGLRVAKQKRLSILCSLIAVSKLHFDLALPWMLRKQGSALWTVALVLLGGSACVQLVVPTVSLTLTLLPSRRETGAAQSTALQLLEEEEQKFMVADTPRLAVLGEAGGGGSDSAQSTCAALPASSNGACAVWTPPPQPTWRERLARQQKEAKWQMQVWNSTSRPTCPESLQRRRLVSLYAFMDSSGWYVATAMTRGVVEHFAGLEVQSLEARWVPLMMFVGGLDLLALHAWLLVAFLSNLTFFEFVIPIVACSSGVLQAVRPGVGPAFFEQGKRWFFSSISRGLAVLVSVAVIRTALDWPLVSNCSDAGLASGAVLLAVLLLELPACIAVYPFWQIEFRGERVSLCSNHWCKRVTKSLCGGNTKKKAALTSQTKKKKQQPAAPVALLAGDRKANVKTGGQAWNRTSLVPSTVLPAEMAKELPSATVLKYPGSEPLVTALFHFIAAIPEELRSDLLGAEQMTIEDEDADAIIQSKTKRTGEGMKSEQQDGDEDVDGSEKPLVRQLQKGFEQLLDPKESSEITARLTRLATASVTVGRIAPKLFGQPWSCRQAFDGLVEVLEMELRAAKFVARAQMLARSWHYRAATLRDREALIGVALPEAPRIWLVHWRTLERLKRLPDLGEAEYLVTASAAYQEHGSQAMLVPVVHHWRTRHVADPQGVTCRQLLIFAQWYRSRWGKALELYFWLDSCCWPELVSASSGVLEQAAQGRHRTSAGLSEAAQRGLQTLPCFQAMQSCPSEQVQVASQQQQQQQQPQQSPPQQQQQQQQETKTQKGQEQRAQPQKPEQSSAASNIVTQIAGDATLPLIFAAADAIVVCECKGIANDGWARLGMELAYAFSQNCRLVYSVDRKLIHLPHHSRNVEEKSPRRSEAVRSGSFGLGDSITFGIAADGLGLGGEEAEDVALFEEEGRYGHQLGLTSAFFAEPTKKSRFLAKRAVGRLERHKLTDPTDWASVDLHRPETDRPRLARLHVACHDLPTCKGVTGFAREPLRLDDSWLDIVCLQTKVTLRNKLAGSVASKPDTRVTALPPPTSEDLVGAQIYDDTSSESSEEEDDDDVKEAKAASSAMKMEADWDVTVLSPKSTLHEAASPKPGDLTVQPVLDESPLAGYAAALQPKRLPLQQAARCFQPAADRIGISAEQLLKLATAGSTKNSVHRATVFGSSLHRRPLPPPKGTRDPELVFHDTFKPPTILIAGMSQTAEQIRGVVREKVEATDRSHHPSGGFAILAQPLQPRAGVAPDRPEDSGVFFNITVALADACWQDGLGIGFTLQDPDAWPSHKVQPRYALSIPHSFLCGYSGRWLIDGKTDFIKKVAGSSHSWVPKTLRAGDVVTAVLVGGTRRLFRVLVNGDLVAEIASDEADLPDPTSVRLWGVVDIDGCCVKVQLGAGLHERTSIDLRDFVSNSYVRPQMH